MLQEKWELPHRWKLSRLAGHASRLLPKAVLSSGRVNPGWPPATGGLPARSHSAELWASPLSTVPTPGCPHWQQTLPHSSPEQSSNFSPLPLLNVLLLIFEISSCVCCLFTMLSSNSVTLVWSYLILFSGPFLSLFFFPYYSPNFMCLLAIHLFFCWLLFLQWFLSLYGPVFKSVL